jgi:subtilisin-like proprotein convertase family protein
LKKIALLIFAALFCVFNLSAQEKNISRNPALNLIQQDYESGKINYEEALLQKFYLAFNKSKSLYKTSASVFPQKCGTELIREFRSNTYKLSASAVAEIEEFLNAPFRITAETKTYISPSGKFELTYETSGTNAVPSADTDSDGVPDYVEWVASYFDYSWTFDFDTLGYLPVPIGTGRYQVGFEDMGYYGYTDVVNSGTRITRIVMENDYKGFPSNDDPEGKQKGAAKVTAIHEFKHAVQYVYNRWIDPGWFIEMDATWMEDIGYDYVNDYYNYLSQSQIIESTRSFSESNSDDDLVGYRDCLWLHYLSQKHGVAINRLLWERRKSYSSENIYTAFDRILGGYSSSYADGIREYFAWNYATGLRANGAFESYEEAAEYPTSKLCLDISVLPDSSEGCNLSPSGAAYLRYKSSGVNSNFKVEISSGQAGPYGVEILILYKDGTGKRISVPLETTSLEYTVPESLQDISYVTVIPVVAASGGSTRSYSCKVIPLTGAEFSHTPVTDTETPSEKIIKVTLSDEYGFSVTDSLQLHYNINNTGYHAVRMIPTGTGNEYSAVIPDAAPGSVIQYYLSIYNLFGQYTYYPAGGPAEPLHYYMGADITPPTIVHSERSVINKLNFPFTIYAEAEDNIGMDSVYAEYKINNGGTVILSMPMVKDGIYAGEVSPENTGDITNFSYRVVAVDSSSQHNITAYPEEGFISVDISFGYEYSSKPGKAIKDIFVLGVKDTIFVNQNIEISDIDIYLNVTHPRSGDLMVKITPPFEKSSSLLFSRPGLTAGYPDIIDADITIDQDAYFTAGEFIPSGDKKFTGKFIPDTLNLDNFNGQNAKGAWILNISDIMKEETGTLNEWKLIISTNNAVSVNEDKIQPVKEYSLLQNYPNPFNPSTVISYVIPSETFVELKVFDILGREVSSLVNEVKKPGTYQVNFNADNLSTGVYFYRLKTNAFSAVKKMMLIQ